MTPGQKDRSLPELALADLDRRHGNIGEAIVAALARTPGCVVVSGVPLDDDNEALLRLANSLGTVTERGTTIPGHPLEHGGVYRVEPVNNGDGVRDEDDLLIFSTTEQVFEVHTDGYHNETPPDYVLLLCIRPDVGEFGRTSIIDVKDVVPALGAELVDLLREPCYPCSFGRTPILTGPPDSPMIRFNHKEISRFVAAGNSTTERHRDAAKALEATLSNPDLSWRHVLQPGRCLVLDNRRALHGRASLSPGSTRLLKRVWVHRQS